MRSVFRYSQLVCCLLPKSRMFSSTASDGVVFSRKGCAGIIELNRTKALNALSLPMIRRIYPQLMQWESDPDVALIIIKGAGEKAFCAGGDVRAIAEATKTGNSLPQDFFREEYILNHAIGTCKRPYIALIDGITMGGGVGISVHGDFRVATERTVFAMPETAIGLFPDVGGGFFLSRLHQKVGYFLALTGFRLKAADVKKSGIATHYVDSKNLGLLEDSLCELKDTSTAGVRSLLFKFEKESSYDVKQPFVLSSNLRDIETHFKFLTVEEIMDSLRSANSDWCKKHLDIMLRMSPTSMKITLRQLQLSAQMTLAQVLKMEYRLSQRCMEDHDFYEGVRAALIDKDQKPQWKPATLPEVTQSKVDFYFSMLPASKELVLDESRV